MQKKKLLYRGKVKSMYETDDPEYLVVEFHDDMTAFDGEKHEKLAQKGAVNHRISHFIMQKLSAAGIPTHCVKRLSDCESLVKRLKMVPLECVVRNVAAGSLCRRLGVAAELALNPPLYELFLKNDALHDPMVCEEHALAFGWADQQQLDQMREYSISINRILKALFADAGLLLVDAKYEFGIDSGGMLCLGDEISPDSCRIWDAKTYESLDKDRFRKDMGDVIASYWQIAHRLGI
jgi:phosphoribosylaminoimidazole-succinocarboxamide synthase